MKRFHLGSISPCAVFMAVVLSCFLSVLVGCKKDEITNPEKAAYVLDTTLAIWPLKVGNSSSFRELTLSASGSITSTIQYGPFSVTKDSVVGTSTWYFDGTWNGWIWKGAGGMWVKFPMLAPGFDTTRNMLIKWPCKKGDTYNTHLAGSAMDVEATVTAVDELVSVPAVAETCVVYEFRNSGQLVERWYLAPGLGWLRTDDYYTNDPATNFGTALLPLTSYIHHRFEITSYHLAKAR